MSNAREEILRLSTERLKNKVETVMFSINIILSNPDNCDNQIGKVDFFVFSGIMVYKFELFL